MPKGVHYGYTAKRRSHLEDLARLTTHEIKAALKESSKTPAPVKLQQHSNAELIASTPLEGDTGVLTVKINKKVHQLNYQYCFASVTKKFYLNCPLCQNKRQYLLTVGHFVLCRECVPFHYRSQSANKTQRLLENIRKLQAQITGKPRQAIEPILHNLFLSSPPKGKHYAKHLQRIDLLEKLQAQYFTRITHCSYSSQ